MFKVNSKNTRTTLMTLFWYFFVNFEHISHLFSKVSIVEFKQVNVNQGRGVFVELEHLGKHFVKNTRKKAPQGKILKFFFLDTLKITF